MNKNSIDKKERLGNAPIVPLLIKLAIPSSVSALALAAYNIIDSIFVSGVNQSALTGMYIIAPIDLLISALSIGTGIGATSCLSRMLGKKDYKFAKSSAFNGLFCGFFVWIIFAIIGYFVSDLFVSAFTNDAQVVAYATSYMKIVSVGSLGAIIGQIGFSVLEGTGQMALPMIVQIVGIVINITFDPILIYGWGIFPRLEVAGAAYSTIFSQLISMVLTLLILYNKKNKTFYLCKSDCKLNKTIIVEIIKVGIPASLTQIVSSIMTFCLNYIWSAYSSSAIAAYGIYNKIFSFLYMPVFGIVRAAFPILGYSIGAKNYDRFKKTVIYASIISGIYLLIGTFIFWIFPEQIASWFNPDEELLATTCKCFRILSLTYVVIGISIPISTCFNPAGHSFLFLASGIFRQLLLIVPLSYVFARNFGGDNIWWAFTIADILNFVFVLIMFKIYMKKIR